MQLSDIKNIECTDKQLKECGNVVGGIFLVLGGFFWWKQAHFYQLFIGLGTVLLVVRIIYFKWLKPFYYFWMGLSIVLGFFVSRIILTILYYFILTPISLLARIVGKKFLVTSYRTDEDTYWVPKEDRVRDKSYFEKQY